MPTPNGRRSKRNHTQGSAFLGADRAICVTGDIDDDMVTRLTSRIVALTQTSGPVTVFLDSNGGIVRAAEVISGLLRTRAPPVASEH